uniref:Uncharacterized protein n=1 Tax=Amphidinium carterae TaxID=2961 RepID=A7YXF3_AMPCA|nr:unknown [Amphidinium carterae]
MIRETQGMFVAGDKTTIAYLRHVCSADQAMPALHSLDEKHAFATGSHGAAKLLDEKIEAFVSQNMLEPPEESPGAGHSRKESAASTSNAGGTAQGRGGRKRGPPRTQ